MTLRLVHLSGATVWWATWILADGSAVSTKAVNDADPGPPPAADAEHMHTLGFLAVDTPDGFPLARDCWEQDGKLWVALSNDPWEQFTMQRRVVVRDANGMVEYLAPGIERTELVVDIEINNRAVFAPYDLANLDAIDAELPAPTARTMVKR